MARSNTSKLASQPGEMCEFISSVWSVCTCYLHAHVIYMHMFLLIAGTERVVRAISFTPVQFSHPVEPSTWFLGGGHSFAAAESKILVSKVGADLQLCCCCQNIPQSSEWAHTGTTASTSSVCVSQCKNKTLWDKLFYFEPFLNVSNTTAYTFFYCYHCNCK